MYFGFDHNIESKLKLNRYYYIILSILIGVTSAAQEKTPLIHDVTYINTDDGLTDRIINKLGRTDEGLYYFYTDKLQFYTGDDLLDDIVSIPNIVAANSSLILASDNFFYNYAGDKLFALDYNENDNVSIAVVDNEFRLITRDEATYTLHRLSNRQWESMVEIVSDAPLTVIEKSDSMTCYITEDKKVICNNQIVMRGDTLADMIIPNDDYLRIDDNEIYFSVKNKQGTYHLDHNGKIMALDESLVIHEITKDNYGRLLLLLRNEKRIIERVILIDENDERQDWSFILDYSNIIIESFSENLKSYLSLATYNGIVTIQFVKSNALIKKYLHREEKDDWGFGRLIIDLDLDSEGKLLSASEVGPIFRNYKKEESYQLDQTLRDLTKIVHYDDSRSKHWLTTVNSGLKSRIYSIDARDKVKVEYETQGIYTVYQSEGDDIFFGGVEGHIIRLDKNDKFVDYGDGLDLPRERVRSMYMEEENIIGTNQGLYRITTGSNQQKAQRIHTSVINGPVISIRKYSDDYLIGTYGSGLYVLDDTLGIKKVINQNCCSINNYMYSTEKDENNNYWMGTNDGLYVMDSTYTIRDHYTLTDGISDKEFNTQASTRSEDGKIYFGTINGITVVDPTEYISDPVGDFYIKEVLSYRDNDVIVGQEEHLVHRFNFEPDSIIIEMEACGFGHAEFSYAVKNDLSLDEHVSYRLDQDQLILYGLPYGEHLLYINGRNKVPLSIVLERDYAALLRNAALYLFSILVLGYALYRFLDSRNKRRLEESHKEKQMAQIKLEALRSQLNPHFIFNSLGAISYFIQNKENRSANNYLTKFAKLLRGFLESSKNEYLTVAEEIQLIKYYLDLEKMRFGKAFEYSIDYSVAVDIHHEILPTMMIQPFVENALIHGISHRQDDRGEINIIFDKVDDVLRCTIDDNGIGRVAAAEIKKSSIKKHKSRATEIIEDRVRFAELSDELRISIDILDKYNGDTPIGTKVILTIENQEIT